MRYLSICSGIEAATVAWHPLGWTPAAFSEIEPFPRAVLRHHYPDTPLHGDFTTIGADDYGPIDLLVGGTPCQSFSIAGLRGGLADDRGNLALEFLRLADRTRPRWLVWENVPGVLSSDGGRDFGSILGGLVELGYGFAYRVLDAQHFGVPQRRRRVFVVGHLGDWRRAAAVLFERHSLSGHPAPRREAGQGITASPEGISGACSSKWSKGSGGPAGDEHYNLIAHTPRVEAFDAGEGGTGRGTPLVPVHYRDVASALTSNYGKQPDSSDTALGPNLVAFAADDYQSGSFVQVDQAAPLTTSADRTRAAPIAFAQNSRDEVRIFGGDGQTVGALAAEPGMKQQSYVAFSAKDHGADAMVDCSPTLRAGGHSKSHANAGVMPAVAMTFDSKDGTLGTADITSTLTTNGETGKAGGRLAFCGGSAVRRLTPVECERLQGFPDDYTLVPYRNKPAADGPRYKALGNSMAVPVMRWIGERIAKVEAL